MKQPPYDSFGFDSFTPHPSATARRPFAYRTGTMLEIKEKLQACMGRKDRTAEGTIAGVNAARPLVPTELYALVLSSENEKNDIRGAKPKLCHCLLSP